MVNTSSTFRGGLGEWWDGGHGVFFPLRSNELEHLKPSQTISNLHKPSRFEEVEVGEVDFLRYLLPNFIAMIGSRIFGRNRHHSQLLTSNPRRPWKSMVRFCLKIGHPQMKWYSNGLSDLSSYHHFQVSQFNLTEVRGNQVIIIFLGKNNMDYMDSGGVTTKDWFGGNMVQALWCRRAMGALGRWSWLWSEGGPQIQTAIVGGTMVYLWTDVFEYMIFNII